MNDDKEKNRKRAESFVLDRDIAIYDELQDLTDAAKTIVESLEDIDTEKLSTLKGEKGDSPTKEELVSLIKPLIPSPIPGEPGKPGQTPTKDQIVALVSSLIPDPVPGKDAESPTEEKLLSLIRPLIPQAVPGKDGSPDTAEELLKKIRSLPKGKRLNITDLDDLEKLLRPQVTQQQGRGLKGLWAGAANQFVIKSAGVEIGKDIRSINFIGSAVASVSNSNGDVTVTIQQGGGGGGVTFETPAGTVDGSNVTFVVLNVPAYIVMDGTTYFENNGYTRSSLTLTTTVPPVGFIRSAY